VVAGGDLGEGHPGPTRGAPALLGGGAGPWRHVEPLFPVEGGPQPGGPPLRVPGGHRGGPQPKRRGPHLPRPHRDILLGLPVPG